MKSRTAAGVERFSGQPRSHRTRPVPGLRSRTRPAPEWGKAAAQPPAKAAGPATPRMCLCKSGGDPLERLRAAPRTPGSRAGFLIGSVSRSSPYRIPLLIPVSRVLAWGKANGSAIDTLFAKVHTRAAWLPLKGGKKSPHSKAFGVSAAGPVQDVFMRLGARPAHGRPLPRIQQRPGFDSLPRGKSPGS